MNCYCRLIPLFLLLITSSAHAEIYRWTDNRGTDHFTNSSYEIPDRYRAQAKTVNLGIPEHKTDQPQPAQPAPSQFASSPSQTPTASAAPLSSSQTPPAQAAPRPDARTTPVVNTKKSFRPSRRSSEEE